jgi:phosphatidylcholine synthase
MMGTEQAPVRARAAGRRTLRQLLGWCVHFYTALGLVAAAGIAVCIVQDTPASYRWAFILMFVATLIDATDGALARVVRIKEVLPGFDGRRLDDLIDFLTYTFLPLLLVWRADILPAGQAAWLLFPLVASAYGFCQVEAKTADGYFLGFPSYWNLVAFYLYLLHEHVMRLPGWLSIGVLVGLAILTFVPSRYLYPSQKGRLNQLTSALGIVWAGLLMAILYRLPVERPPGGEGARDTITQAMILVSLLFPAYYLIASWVVSLLRWRTLMGKR